MNYEHHIFICTRERDGKASCRGEALQKKFKECLKKKGVSLKKVRANKSGCLDQCAFGPTVVVYPEGIWYGGVSEADVEEIVESHIIGGEPVERLMMKRK